MSTELAPTNGAQMVEQVVINGDLSKLSAAQRVTYYREVCDSLGLNALTKPFDYITLNGKLTLYARKDCADQLRRRHNISIERPEIEYVDDWIVVSVLARDATGRTDSDIGVVSRKDMRGDFGNALMKAITKAKRRVTLSICGLGMLDETEIGSIPDAGPVMVDASTGEILDRPAPPATDKQRNYIGGLQDKLGWHSEQLAAYANEQGIDLVAMTAAQASEFIEGMRALAEERAPKSTNGKKTPSRDGLLIRLNETIEEAKALDIEVGDTTTIGRTDAELIAAGQKLRALIDAAKRKAAMHEEADLPL